MNPHRATRQTVDEDNCPSICRACVPLDYAHFGAAVIETRHPVPAAQSDAGSLTIVDAATTPTAPTGAGPSLFWTEHTLHTSEDNSRENHDAR